MHTIDTKLGSHVQAHQFNRLSIFVHQVHQNRRVPLGEHTPNNAIARKPHNPFSSLASGFLRNKSKNFPRLWSSAVFLKPVLEPMRDLVQSPLVHQAVCRPVGLVLQHFPLARRTLSTVIRLPWRAIKPSPQLLWYRILSACTSCVSIARPLTQSFVTTGLWTTLLLGKATVPASIHCRLHGPFSARTSASPGPCILLPLPPSP